MIEGRVSRRGVPTIEVSIANRSFRAIIDTGFNGFLELPEDVRTEVNPRFIGRVKSNLAGGVTIHEDVFLVDFQFDGELMTAEATFVEGHEILIGTRLLRKHRLEINFVARTLHIEQVN